MEDFFSSQESIWYDESSGVKGKGNSEVGTLESANILNLLYIFKIILTKKKNPWNVARTYFFTNENCRRR